jgi:hypothetical protein
VGLERYVLDQLPGVVELEAGSDGLDETAAQANCSRNSRPIIAALLQSAFRANGRIPASCSNQHA